MKMDIPSWENKTMPINAVKPGQEAEWEKAKEAARKQYPDLEEGDRFNSIAMAIFQKMTGGEKALFFHDDDLGYVLEKAMARQKIVHLLRKAKTPDDQAPKKPDEQAKPTESDDKKKSSDRYTNDGKMNHVGKKAYFSHGKDQRILCGEVVGHGKDGVNIRDEGGDLHQVEHGYYEVHEGEDRDFGNNGDYGAKV